MHLFPGPLQYGGPWPAYVWPLHPVLPAQPHSQTYTMKDDTLASHQDCALPTYSYHLPTPWALGVCQWVLCQTVGRTAHVQALRVGLAYLSRDSQGSSTWSMVWVSTCPRLLDSSHTGGVQVEEAYGEPSKVLGPHGLDLRNVIPSCTFCFQIM